MQTIYFQSANQDRFPLHVVDEESHQSNIQNIVPYDAGENKTFKDDSFTAELILDDDNPSDPGNAVRVEINGQIVGYLSKQHATKYRHALASLNLSSTTGKCGAAIYGNKKEDAEVMNFGVWLDLDLDHLKPEGATQTPAPVAAAVPVAPPIPVAPSSKGTELPPPPGSRSSLTPTQKPNRTTLIIIIAIAVLVMVVCCCIPMILNVLNPKPTATAVNVEQARTQLAGTLLAAASQTTEAGITPTPEATETPESTETPSFTETPKPTLAPVVLTGTGDDVVDVAKWPGAAIAQIKYTGGGNFAVISFDGDGKRIDLLVNEIGNYSGTVPIDFLKADKTARFEVHANGPWEIRLLPIEQMRVEMVPGKFQGTGDEVVRLGGGTPDLLNIDAGQNTGNFVIWGYGDTRDLLVNEIGAYTGKVIVGRGIYILVIHAGGSWSIEVTQK